MSPWSHDNSPAQEPPTDACDRLRRELTGFRASTASPGRGLTLDGLLAGIAACRMVKDSPRRRVYSVAALGRDFFLKIGTPPRPGHPWRQVLSSRRWSAEWRNLHRLGGRGIAAAGPVMYGERRRGGAPGFFLVTERVRGTALSHVAEPPVEALGRFLAGIHRRGVYPADLHPQNIVIGPDGRPSLIDAQEVFFLPWLPAALRRRNLGCLLFYLQDNGRAPDWWTALIEAYNRGFRCAARVSQTDRAAAGHRLRRLRSRSKRCCRESTEFTAVRAGRLRGYRRRDFSLTFEETRAAFENGRPLKDNHVRAFRDLVIKIHRPGWFHRDRCLSSWKMAHALTVRGIEGPCALAYFRSPAGSWFVAEFLADSQPLNAYLSSLDDSRAKRRALARLASWLRRIHAAGIWQRDFKSGNVLCRNGTYFLVDLDGVRLEPVGQERVIINLAQLNASVSHAVTLKDRLRFYRYYSRGAEETRAERRRVFEAVWTISRTKNTAASGLDLEKLRPAV
jgi:tRNA A-37 threonylcarbamoyl transferase component Bud32